MEKLGAEGCKPGCAALMYPQQPDGLSKSNSISFPAAIVAFGRSEERQILQGLFLPSHVSSASWRHQEGITNVPLLYGLHGVCLQLCAWAGCRTGLC